MPRAIFITGEATIELQEVPKPVPADNEILVRVHAAGLNPADCTYRMLFPMRTHKYPRRREGRAFPLATGAGDHARV